MNVEKDAKSGYVGKEEKLDRALAQTFPASDPVSAEHATGTEHLSSDPARKAPKVSAQDVEAASVETEVCPRCHGTGKLVSAKHDPAKQD